MLATGDSPVAGTLSAAVLVQNDPGSSNNLLIGDSTNQYFSLKAGQACTVPCSNGSKVHASL